MKLKGFARFLEKGQRASGCSFLTHAKTGQGNKALHIEQKNLLPQGQMQANVNHMPATTYVCKN